MKKPVILFRASLAEEEELLTAKKYFEVSEQRNGIKDSYVIGRYSTLPYYKELEEDLRINNSTLVNSYKQYKWIADFEWYEALEQFTFKTWFNAVELPDDGTKFIVKGKTNSRKQQWDTMMFANNKRDAIEIGWKLGQDALIGEQGVVYRKYEKLVTYEIGINGLPFTNEWRFFFYKGKPLSYGYYWSIADQVKTKSDLPQEAYEFACEVAGVAKDYANFFVLDIAQKESGEWVLVEVNDGQMAGTSCIDYNELYFKLAIEIRQENITIDPTLDRYHDQTLFPEKLAQANDVILKTKLPDEFTEKMFSELTISKNKEKNIKCMIVERQIERDGFDKVITLESYGLTEDDYDNYLKNK